MPATPGPTGTILFGRWDPRLQQSAWFTVGVDGTGIRDLRVVATCARWWPDRSKILITDDAAVGPGHPLRPATVNPDGSGPRPLDAAKDPTLNLGCGWVSPDGQTIALEGFNDRRAGSNGICAVRATDGGGLTRLTYSPPGGGDADPAYSPDGSRIVFFRSKPGVSPQGAGAIFVMNADGSGLRRITPWGVRSTVRHGRRTVRGSRTSVRTECCRWFIRMGPACTMFPSPSRRARARRTHPGRRMEDGSRSVWRRGAM